VEWERAKSRPRRTRQLGLQPAAPQSARERVLPEADAYRTLFPSAQTIARQSMNDRPVQRNCRARRSLKRRGLLPKSSSISLRPVISARLANRQRGHFLPPPVAPPDRAFY